MNIEIFGDDSPLSGKTKYDVLFANNITGDTIYISNIGNIIEVLNNKADISGSTFLGGVISETLSANTITATTYFSGSSDINTLFAPTIHTHPISAITDLQTTLETKVNNSTFTAYTANTVSILNNKADLSGGTFTGGVFGTSFSANTFSGGTFYGDGSNLTGVGEIVTGQNVGGGTGQIFKDKTGTTLNFRTLTSTGGTVNISNNTDTINLETVFSGGGEANTASNIGSGFGLYKEKVGVDLRFISLSAGTNITFVTGDTLTINSTASGGSSRTKNLLTTTNATPTLVAKISGITDNTTSIIEVYVKAYSASAANWGVWKRTLTITKVSGTVTVRGVNADVDRQSTSLRANSISFAANSGDVDVTVTGIAATTINWESAHEIIV